jgi:hypothetical protein
MKGKNGVTLISFSELRDETGCTHTTLHKYLSRAKIRASKTVKVGNGILRYYDPDKLVAFKQQLKSGTLKHAVGRPRKTSALPVLNDVAKPASIAELDDLRTFLNPLPEMEIILMRYQNFTDKRIARMQESIDNLIRSINAVLRGDYHAPAYGPSNSNPYDLDFDWELWHTAPEANVRARDPARAQPAPSLVR